MVLPYPFVMVVFFKFSVLNGLARHLATVPLCWNCKLSARELIQYISPSCRYRLGEARTASRSSTALWLKKSGSVSGKMMWIRALQAGSPYIPSRICITMSCLPSFSWIRLCSTSRSSYSTQQNTNME